VVHKLPFHQRQQSLRRLVQSAVAKLGADGILRTSGYGDGYYYECTYTPSHAKKAAYSSGNYHSYYSNGYHVECNYTYDVAPVKKAPQMPAASEMPAASQNRPAAPQQSHHYYSCTYTVMQGDNISSIANYYGITYTRLAKANYLKYPYYIFPGDVLHVPCKY